MRYVHAMLLLLLCCCALPAPAQQARIGYVDMKKILDHAPQVVAGRERLDIEFRARNDALRNDEERLATLQNQLQLDSNLDASERLRLEQESRLLSRSIQRRRDDLRQELQLRRNEEISSVEEDINQAIATIASSRGYDLIVASPVVYVSERIDITAEILQHLQQEYAADQAEQE